jgi:hypothetical protein
MRDVAPNVGKLKKKLVRAEKNGGAGKRQEKRVERVNLTTTIINHQSSSTLRELATTDLCPTLTSIGKRKCSN